MVLIRAWKSQILKKLGKEKPTGELAEFLGKNIFLIAPSP